MAKQKVVAIIQARMGSSRLPGKVLMDICGKSMLERVAGRVAKSKLTDAVIVATGTDTADDPISELCSRNNISCYRGSLTDVLDRYYHAAKADNAAFVVRVTADCPLIDPEVCDKVIAGLIEHPDKYDYASNIIERTYPRGLDTEVFKFCVLEDAWKKAKTAYQREHVTIYMYEVRGRCALLNIKNSKDLSSYRWTVDEADDLDFVRRIYARLRDDFGMGDVIELLEKEPELLKINSHVRQKDTFK